MLKINIYYDIDRPGASRDSLIGPTISPSLDKGRVTAPTRAKLSRLDEAIIPKFTSEESAKEKARILSLLDKLHFVDAMKAYAQAVVQNNYVPKELVISARKTVNAEMGNLIELGESLPRMIDSDAREVIFTMLGGEDAFKAMIRALPKTLVEMPTDQEGTEVKKVSGITLMHWLPEYLKKMAN